MHVWYCRVCWYEWQTPFQTALTTDPMPVQCPHCHSPDIRNADAQVQGWARAVVEARKRALVRALGESS